MYTQWFFPTTVSQYAEIEEDIAWNDDNSFLNLKHADGTFLTLSRPLLRIANPTVNDIKMKTYYLKLTNFNVIFPFNQLNGVELELNMNRGGRITDDTIQLLYDDAAIGENLINLDLAPKKLYGGPTDLWGAALTQEMIEDTSFGVLLRFQSHPAWPHREYAKIDYARLRFY